MRARVIGWKGGLGRAKPARDPLETVSGILKHRMVLSGRTVHRADICDIHRHVTRNVGHAAKTYLSHWLVLRGAEPHEITSICCFFLTHMVGSFMWSNLIVMGTEVHCKPLAYGNERNLSIKIL